MKHTHGQWQIVKNPMRDDGWFVCYAGDDAKPCDGLPDGVPPAVIPIQLDYDTAHRIVTGVNCHDDLIAALDRLIPWIGKMIADNAHRNSVAPLDCENGLRQAEAALAKARNEQEIRR